MKRFLSARDNQLVLHFPDGNLSCIWGFGTYSDNHKIKFPKNKEETFFGKFFGYPMESDTIEIMYEIDNPAKLKKVIKKFGDDNNPLGYVSFEDWLWLVNLMNK